MQNRTVPPASTASRRPLAALARYAAARVPAVVIGATLAAVAGCTGFISYTHICALTLVLGQSWKTAHLMPFGVDGQIIIGSVVLLVLTRGRWWGLVGIIPGLAESLFANWESGAPHGLLAAGWATVAAQAFAVSSFLFERWIKSQVSRGTQDGPATVADAQAEAASEVAEDAAPEVSRPLAPDEALQGLLDSGPEQVLALLLGVSRNKIRALKDRMETAGAPEDGEDAGAVQGPAPAIRYADPGPPFVTVPRLRRTGGPGPEMNGSAGG